MDSNNFDHEKLETRGNQKSEAMGIGLFYGGNPLTVGSNNMHFGINQKNKSNELFISSMGETGSNELKFFNLTGDIREHQSFQRVELKIDGCNYLTVHSKLHLTVLMASNNGSVFTWYSRPSKFIQPTAPGFHEIERNIWYVECEDEFEEEFKDKKQIAILEKWENKNKHNGL